MEVVSTNPNPDSRLNDPTKSNGDVGGINGASSVMLGSRWKKKKKSEDKNKKKRKRKRKKLEEEEEVNGAIEDLKMENKNDAGDCDEIVDQLDEREFTKSDEEFYNALASDTSTSSDDDDDKNSQKQMKKKNKQALLPWMRKPLDIDMFKDCPLSMIPCLDPRLEDALRNMGFESIFAVQLAVWHLTIGPGSFERDVCVNSPTGSGKTLAYALPIVQVLSTKMLRRLYALIVVPTRDLAMQVKQIFDALAPAVGLNVGLAVGQSSIEKERSSLIRRPELEMGMPFDPEYSQVAYSNVDILVATPGRLVDHINTTKDFTLEHLRYLVVDEVDRLVGEDYQFWVPAVLEMASSKERRELEQDRMLGSFGTFSSVWTLRGSKYNPYTRIAKMIFSATLTKDPNKLDQLHLYHPVYLTSGDRRYSLPQKLESYGLICTTKEKLFYLAALLEDLQGEKCIVFTSSIELTHRLSSALILLGCLPCKINEYSRLQKQSIRSKTLKDFREGRIDVLVSSDGMTRGMDVEGIKNVINYDMPPYVKKYIHRAGRTARACQAGRCFTFLRKNEVKFFKNMLEKVGIDSFNAYNLPTASLERLEPLCTKAMEKLIELEDSKSSKR